MGEAVFIQVDLVRAVSPTIRTLCPTVVRWCGVGAPMALCSRDPRRWHGMSEFWVLEGHRRTEVEQVMVPWQKWTDVFCHMDGMCPVGRSPCRDRVRAGL